MIIRDTARWLHAGLTRFNAECPTLTACRHTVRRNLPQQGSVLSKDIKHPAEWVAVAMLWPMGPTGDPTADSRFSTNNFACSDSNRSRL